MHDPTLNRRVLTIPAAAHRIGRSERTIRRWISEGRLESVGGLVYERQLLHAVRDAEQRATRRGQDGHGRNLQVRPEMVIS